MFYAVGFAILAAACGWMAVDGGLALLWTWPAVAFGVVSVAYAGAGPRPFGKRPDGSVAPAATVVLLPFLAYARAVWHARRLLSSEPAAHEIVPGLWLGRRPLDGELPNGTAVVIDFAAELPAVASTRQVDGYRSVPTLDATATRPAELAAAARHVETAGGVAYIGCAFGHGRSAALMAVLLVRRGSAADVADAERLIRRTRPGVRLTPSQRAAATAAVHLLNR